MSVFRYPQLPYGASQEQLMAWATELIRVLELKAQTQQFGDADTIQGHKVVDGAITMNKLAQDVQDAITAGSGQVQVSENDTTTGFLSVKAVPGNGITTTILDPSGDESLEISVAPKTPLTNAGYDADGEFTEISNGDGIVRDSTSISVDFTSEGALLAREFGRMHVGSETAAGVDAGSMTSNVWFSHPINTVYSNTIDGADITLSGYVELPPGTYRITSMATTYYMNYSRGRIYNRTTDELVGYSVSCAARNIGTNHYNSASTVLNPVDCLVTLTETTELSFDVIAAAGGGNSAGPGNNFNSIPEKWADVMITKVG